MFRQILTATDDVNLHKRCQFVFAQRHSHATERVVITAPFFVVLWLTLVFYGFLTTIRDFLPWQSETEQISFNSCPGLLAVHLF